jgi:hypothetical protein
MIFSPKKGPVSWLAVPDGSSGIFACIQRRVPFALCRAVSARDFPAVGGIGGIVCLATFTDGTQGIVEVQMP